MAQVNLALGTMRFGSQMDERTCFDLLDRFAAARRCEERSAGDPDRHATTFRAGLSVPAED